MIQATVKRENPQALRAFPTWAVVGITFFFALATRVPYYRDLVVPLNDGGMFAQIVDDIRANGLRLPSHTGYNSLNLPVSYPPVAFLLAAVLGEVFHLSTLDVLKGMPLFFNLASVGVFVALAARMTSNRLVWAGACFFFALIPQASGWLVMGGGLTRSLGFFFSLLAFLTAYEALRRGSKLQVAGTGVFAALAGLSHLESGTLVVLVLPLFALFYGPARVSVPRLLPAVAVAVLITLPWLGWLEGTVGFEPLRFASKTSGGKPIWQTAGEWLLGLMLTDRHSLLAILVAPTTIWMFWRKNWLIPAWCGVAMILVSRSAYTQVSVPVAMLAAEGWVALWSWRGKGVRDWVPVATWTALGVGLTVWTVTDKYIFGYPLPALKYDSLASLSRDELAAMKWCQENTPAQSNFVVISERMDDWYADMVGEWFPYLSQRHSVLTVQGREWRPNDEFHRWQDLLELAAECPRVRDLEAVVHRTGESFDYAFISGPLYPPKLALAKSFAKHSGYRLLYRRGEVLIYARRQTNAEG